MVRFGGVTGHITSSDLNNINVLVPKGAAYAPISITDAYSGLSRVSPKPFNPVFHGTGLPLDATSFGVAGNFLTGTGDPSDIVTADIDNDGKPDVITSNLSSHSFSIFRNTSDKGVVSFGFKQDFFTGDGPMGITCADLNGDGLLDIIACNRNAKTIVVYQNKSTPGQLLFAARQDYTAGTNPISVVVGDFNNDGKPDVAVVNYASSNISIFKNTSTTTSLSLGLATTLATGRNPYRIAAADLDGDGKIDLGTANTTDGTISILRNVSSATTFSFEAKRDIATGTWPQSLAMGDLNFDGKIDIVVVNSFSHNIAILKNTGPGIKFDANILHLNTDAHASNVYLGQLTGDGDPDIIVAGGTSGHVSVYRNTTKNYEISFDAKKAYPLNNFASALDVCDMDGDGKPDITAVSGNAGRFFILRNQVNGPLITNFSPTTARTGDTVTITGANLSAVTAVNFGGIAASSFKVVSATTITAIVANAASGSINVESSLGLGSKSGFVFKPYCSAGANSLMGSIVFIQHPHRSIRHQGGSTATYSNFLNQTIPLQFGGNYFSISFAAPFSGQIAVYLDLNRDGDFDDPLENLGVFPSSVTNTIAFNFDLHSQFKSGLTAMRIRVSNNGAGANLTPCGNSASGLVEDYGVIIPEYAAPQLTHIGTTNGVIGTRVQVFGSYLLDANYISFGGVEGHITEINGSGGYLFAEVGAGATGDVVLRTPRGTATLKNAFTYLAPVITSFNPPTTKGGRRIYIQGSNLQGATAVTFGGVPAKSFTAHSNGASIQADIAGAASGDVMVTTPGGTAKLPGFIFVGPVIRVIDPAIGTTGTPVTIRGRNFTGEHNVMPTGVTFGGVPATSITYENHRADTMVVAVVGAGATGNVELNTSGGIASFHKFTYLPPATITSFSPTAGTYYSTVSIRGTNFNHVTGVSFGGTAAVSFHVVSDTLITAVVGDGNSGDVSVARLGTTVSRPGFTCTKYCTAGSNGLMPRIYTLSLGSINYVVTGFGFQDSYRNLLNMSTQLHAGLNHMKVSGYDHNGRSQVGVYIDFNRDGDFDDDSEMVYKTPVKDDAYYDFDILVPANAVPGSTRMRVRMLRNWDGKETFSPCGKADYGEVQDYTVIIPESKAPVISGFTPTTATWNDEVTITGTGFKGATTVNFGGTPASSFHIISNTEIKAIVGLGASGNVTVTTSAPASKAGFTYKAFGPPAITSFTPTSGGEDVPVIITGTNLDDVTAVSFGGTPAQSFKIISHTQIEAVTGPGSGGVITLNALAGDATSVDVFNWLAYCPAGATKNATGFYMQNVVVGNAHHNNAATQPYLNLCAQAMPLNVDLTHVRISLVGANTYDAVRVFIDYNQDGDFDDDGEAVYTLPAPTSYATLTDAAFNLKIPATAKVGNTRMRIRLSQYNPPAQNLPCGNYNGISQVQDYTVVVPPGVKRQIAMAGTMQDVQAAAAATLSISVAPNPSKTNFVLTVNGNSNAPVELRVTDMYGRVVHRARGTANQQYIFGETFAAGMYVAEVLQGRETKTIKLIKAR